MSALCCRTASGNTAQPHPWTQIRILISRRGTWDTCPPSSVAASVVFISMPVVPWFYSLPAAWPDLPLKTTEQTSSRIAPFNGSRLQNPLIWDFLGVKGENLPPAHRRIWSRFRKRSHAAEALKAAASLPVEPASFCWAKREANYTKLSNEGILRHKLARNGIC